MFSYDRPDGEETAGDGLLDDWLSGDPPQLSSTFLVSLPISLTSIVPTNPKIPPRKLRGFCHEAMTFPLKCGVDSMSSDVAVVIRGG
jgi:hypothetical protein